MNELLHEAPMVYGDAFKARYDRALESMADALAERMEGKSEDEIRAMLEEYSRTTIADAHAAGGQAVRDEKQGDSNLR